MRMRKMKCPMTVSVACAFVGWMAPAHAADAPDDALRGAAIGDYAAFTVHAPPAALGLDAFYQKYVDAGGIPVTTSARVPDTALLIARDIVTAMLAERPD